MARPESHSHLAVLARGLLFVHLLLSPLVFTTATLELFEYPKVALLRLTALGLAGLGLLALAGRCGPRAAGWHALAAVRDFGREPVTLGILLFTLSAALSTAFSLSPRLSLDGTHESFAGLATVASYAVLFLATRLVCRTAADGWRLLNAVVIASAVAATYAALQAARLDPLRWSDESVVGGYVRPFATVGHANHLATYLAMALPAIVLGAVRAVRNGQRRYAVVLAGVGWLALAGAVLPLSRAGWLALAAVVPLLLTGLWCCGHRRAALAGGGVVLALGGVAVAGLFLGRGAEFRGALVQRVRHFGDGTGRQALWRAGWAMARERPLTGAGLDAFALAFGRHRPAAFWQREWNVTPTKAHSEPVHVLATQGFPGAAAGLVLIVGLVIAFRRAWRRADGDGRLLALAAACAVVGFLVPSLFSFTVAATGTLFVTCAGILARLGDEIRRQGDKETRRQGEMRFLSLSPCLLVSLSPCLAWWGVVRPFQADVCAHSAVALRMSDPVRAVALNEQAVALDPGRATLWAELAESARRAVNGATDPEARRRYARRVDEATGQAVRLVPADARPHARRGELLLGLTGDGLAEPAAALAAFDAALARDPDNPCVRAGAARAAWACGQPELAQAHARHGLAFDPDQADLYAVLGSLAYAAGRLDEAEVRFGEAARHDWHGQQDVCLHALTLWGYCRVRMNQPVGAEAVLRDVLRYRPDWPAPHLALGQALALLGRPGAAEEFRHVIALAPTHPLADEARRWLAAGRE
jgi:O-antigen ligase/Tfp pilus assembly protein PilF